MKIAVSLTIEVDPDAWFQTYGVERDAVRDDVKGYVLGNVRDLPGITETDAIVTLR
jgi:hypothetical protein